MCPGEARHTMGACLSRSSARQHRRNDERYDWEQDAAAGAPIPTGWGPATAPCLPAVDEWWFTGDSVTATVRNPCGAPRVLVLSAVLLDGQDGRPTGVTQSAAWAA